MAADEADILKGMLLAKLHSLEATELAEICVGLNVQIPPNKIGKKSAIYNLIVRHFSSEEVEDSDDNGLEMYQDTLKTVEDKLKAKTVVKEEVTDTKPATRDGEKGVDSKSVGGKSHGASAADGGEPVVRRTEHIRFREFKITGGTVASGASDQLDFSSVCYQINEAKSLGYKFPEIKSGVLKAMKANHPLKTFFENSSPGTEKEFLDHIRSCYPIQDSATLLSQLSNGAQEPTETEMNFVLRMMNLRNRIFKVAEEEDCPIGKKTVNKRFIHAISVGITKDTVRLEVKALLQNDSITDADLLRKLGEIVAQDTESRKIKRPKEAKVNHLGTDDDGGGIIKHVRYKDEEPPTRPEKWAPYLLHQPPTPSEKAMGMKSEIDAKMHELTEKLGGGMIAEVKKLTSKIDVMNTNFDKLTKEHENLKQQVGEQAARPMVNMFGGGKKFAFKKCATCTEAKAYCTHCSICGAGDHKRMACPQKNE